MNLTEAQARDRFVAARRAYLATADGAGRPHLVPVTFAVSVGGPRDGQADTVVIAVDHKPKRHTDLRRLRNIAANDQVSLLVDEYDDADWSRLWWVRADGVAGVLTDERARAAPVAWLVGKYPAYAERPPTGPVIRIEVRRWSGWSARAH